MQFKSVEAVTTVYAAMSMSMTNKLTETYNFVLYNLKELGLAALQGDPLTLLNGGTRETEFYKNLRLLTTT